MEVHVAYGESIKVLAMVITEYAQNRYILLHMSKFTYAVVCTLPPKQTKLHVITTTPSGLVCFGGKRVTYEY